MLHSSHRPTFSSQLPCWICLSRLSLLYRTPSMTRDRTPKKSCAGWCQWQALGSASSKKCQSQTG